LPGGRLTAIRRSEPETAVGGSRNDDSKRPLARKGLTGEPGVPPCSYEAPDDDTAAEIVMKLQCHGAEHTETLRAFTRDEAEAIIRRL